MGQESFPNKIGGKSALRVAQLFLKSYILAVEICKAIIQYKVQTQGKI